MAVLVVVAGLALSKKSEKRIKTVFTAIWIFALVFEIAKIVWETYAGKTVSFEWGGILPLYPCSIFLYAMPLAIFGRDAYGTWDAVMSAPLGFSAGFHTFFYHGAIVFCALVMLRSGYHSYKMAKKPTDLLIPAVPALLVSLVANAVNFSRIGSDYMFFKLNSFFFAPIGAATPDWLSVILVYAIYLFIHALPYLPHYIWTRLKSKA